MEILILLSLLGGFIFMLCIVAELILKFLDLFGWKKVRLSMRDIDELRADIKNINYIMLRKQITWKKASFDRLNGILKIK